MFKINGGHVALPAKFQGRDLNYNPINSDNLFCTFLTGTKKMLSYSTARYARTHARTHAHRILIAV